MEITELECPYCTALVNVTNKEKYDLVYCEDCDSDLEYIGTELIKLE